MTKTVKVVTGLLALMCFSAAPDTEAESRPPVTAENGMVASAADSGNDAMAKRKPVPGLIYGGHDDRRPSGGVAGH